MKQVKQTKKEIFGKQPYFRVWAESENMFIYFEKESVALSYLQDLKAEKENVPYQKVQKWYLTSEQFNSLREL